MAGFLVSAGTSQCKYSWKVYIVLPENFNSGVPFILDQRKTNVNFMGLVFSLSISKPKDKIKIGLLIAKL